MRETERRARLVEHLRADGRASVAELADDLGVTPSTIRRDLQRLAREGRLVRTYGGAALSQGLASSSRGDPHIDAKRAIARAAAARVADDTTIAIGSGTTALAFAREIADRRLTVITNALDVANVLLDRDGIELIVLGGVVRPRMHSMLGHLAELSSQELRADTLFMGIGAISVEQGLMNDSVPEILTDRALRRMSRVGRRARRRLQVRAGRPGLRLRPGRGRRRRHRRLGVARACSRPCGERGVEVEVAGADRPVGRDAGAGGEPAMIEGIVPSEIREGPAAIRATVDAAREPRRGDRACLAGQRHPPRPRHRQRHELPLEPGRGHPLPPPRRARTTRS